MLSLLRRNLFTVYSPTSVIMIQDFSFVDEVVIEGVPGAGKSSSLSTLMPMLETQLCETHVVMLNYRPVRVLQDELEHDPNRTAHLMARCYQPSIRRFHILFRLTTALPTVLSRIKHYERFKAEHDRTGKRILNVLERNELTAAGLFVPCAYYHMYEDEEAMEQTVEPGLRLAWADVQTLQKHMLDLINYIREMTAPARTLLIWMKLPPTTAWERVMKRGQKDEKDGLNISYMRYLHYAHQAFCTSDEEAMVAVNRRIIPFQDLYDVDRDAVLTLDVAPFDEQGPYPAAKELCDRIASFLP